MFALFAEGVFRMVSGLGRGEKLMAVFAACRATLVTTVSMLSSARAAEPGSRQNPHNSAAREYALAASRVRNPTFCRSS